MPNERLMQEIMDGLDRLAEQIEQENKPLSNGDRIRAMTDEELAKMFSGTILCVPEGRCHGNPKTSCYECWLNWLQSAKVKA